MEEGIPEEVLEEMEEIKEEQTEDQVEGQMDASQEYQEGYAAPEPEQKINSDAFLWKASFDHDDTLRTTYLTEGELGRPLFTVRFLLDMEDIAKYYIDPLSEELKIDNRIAKYFWEKIQNITSSGMSNLGFGPLLSVTKRMDITRKKVKGNIDNLKGGRKSR